MPDLVAAWAVDPQADGHDHGMAMNPVNVCVAVLVGGILVWLAAMVAQRRRDGLAEHHFMASCRPTGRAPPHSVLLGLLLADLSVQRT